MARATRCGSIRRCGRSTSVPEIGPALQVDAVHTYYGESHVLQGVSLSVAPSEVLAILGRNGMGKTTLIRTIIGFTPPRLPLRRAVLVLCRTLRYPACVL